MSTQMPVDVRARRRVSPTAGFWILAATFFALTAAASAPSPLYVVYQRQWAMTPLMLTTVFAVYAGTLLAVLLTAGSLSDHLGRRPVLLGALALEVVSMLAFLAADGVGQLLLARGLQGAATGTAMAAITAGLIDLQPPTRPTLGALVNAVAPTAGLAGGAVLSGLLLDHAPSPTRLVFAVLIVMFVLTVLAVLVLPEPVTRRPGALASLRPQVAVPPPVRPAFAAATPAFVATWAVGGLYLALGPSLAVGILGMHSHLAGGLVVGTLTAAGAVAGGLTVNRPSGRVMVSGAAWLGLGIAVTLLSLIEGWVPGFFVGTAAAGVGFGAAFLGAFRSVAAVVEPRRRAELFAAVLVVSYVAFSVPALLAGVATTRFGLEPTTVGYGLAVVVLAAAVPVLDRRARRSNARALARQPFDARAADPVLAPADRRDQSSIGATK